MSFCVFVACKDRAEMEHWKKRDCGDGGTGTEDAPPLFSEWGTLYEVQKHFFYTCSQTSVVVSSSRPFFGKQMGLSM